MFFRLQVEPQTISQGDARLFDDEDAAHEGGSDGQLHGEGRGLAGAVALGEHHASVPGDDRPNDEQASPAPLMREVIVPGMRRSV